MAFYLTGNPGCLICLSKNVLFQCIHSQVQCNLVVNTDISILPGVHMSKQLTNFCTHSEVLLLLKLLYLIPVSEYCRVYALLVTYKNLFRHSVVCKICEDVLSTLFLYFTAATPCTDINLSLVHTPTVMKKSHQMRNGFRRSEPTVYLCDNLSMKGNTHVYREFSSHYLHSPFLWQILSITTQNY